jgi:hypothetical protein
MKDHIYLHRAYKHLPGVTARQMAGMLVVVALFEAGLVLVHGPLTSGFVAGVAAALARCGVPTATFVAPFLPRFVETMPVLTTAYSFPDKEFSLICLLLAALALVVVPSLKGIPRALVIYTCFFAMLTVASGAFFILVPQRFPYDMSEFSRLYMGTELGIWFMLPLVMGLALGPVPAPLAEKSLVILINLAYSLVFGAVRFAAFVIVLREASVFFMAGLFFALGPFVDFVYVVAIYSLYLNRVSLRLRESEGIWQWSS